MTFSFLCPSCQTTITGSDHLAGRRVRCPECDALVEAKQPVKGTIALVPSNSDEKTVMLEPVEVEEAIEHSTPVES